MDGVSLPAIELVAGAFLEFALRDVPRGSRVRAHVGLPLLEWSEATSEARFEMFLLGANGKRIRSATRSIGTASDVATWRWRSVELRLDTDEDPLTLRLELHAAASSRPVGHGWWGGAEIEVHDSGGLHLRRVAAGTPQIPAGGAPTISVLVPVHDPDPVFLEQAIDSVRGQSFAAWQLCLVDDGSSDIRVHEVLERHAAADERIVVGRHERARGISAATNTALGLATGDYVALLDHDDMLVDDALAAVAAVLEVQPEIDMVYTDEELVHEDGRSFVPYLKPDWSPEFFGSVMYTCHLGVYRRALLLELGGFRPPFDGSQDYDLVLRVTERTRRIAHVPRVLYRWRIHEQSAAANTDAKPYAYRAARLALAEHLERTGVVGTVEYGKERGEYRVRYAVPRTARAALLISLSGSQLSGAIEQTIVRCARSWRPEAGMACEVVLGGQRSTVARATELMWTAGLDASSVHTVILDEEMSRPEQVNRMSATVAADHVVIFDGLAEAVSPDWLSCLLGFASRAGVGAVGAKVLSADGRIEHAGVVVASAVPLPVLQGEDESAAGHLGNVRVATNFSAVDGVVAMPHEVFDQLGGLDASMGALAVVDYCLRARTAGLRTVSAPMATFVRPRAEGPVANDIAALLAFRHRWSGAAPDPYFNPGFWWGRADFQPRD